MTPEEMAEDLIEKVCNFDRPPNTKWIKAIYVNPNYVHVVIHSTMDFDPYNDLPNWGKIHKYYSDKGVKAIYGSFIKPYSNEDVRCVWSES
jgi:hypothetical protein